MRILQVQQCPVLDVLSTFSARLHLSGLPSWSPPLISRLRDRLVVYKRGESGRSANLAGPTTPYVWYVNFMLYYCTSSFSSRRAFINYMPSAFRISSPNLTYSARQSGLRSVAGLILCTGAPLMTFLIGTDQSAVPWEQLIYQLTFHLFSCECNGDIANLDDPSWDMTSAPGDPDRSLDLLD